MKKKIALGAVGLVLVFSLFSFDAGDKYFAIAKNLDIFATLFKEVNTYYVDEINPNQGYLSNRIRPQGTMEKCHFCLHRTREGCAPACLEACPTGARVFGDLNDPRSAISSRLRELGSISLRADLGVDPGVRYQGL